MPPSAYTPPQPTNAYVTSVTDTFGTQTEGYYFGSGNVAVATDYSGESTFGHYADGLDRPTEEIDPIGWTLATYSSATQTDTYAAVGDAAPSTGCASCKHTQTNLDTWGRTVSNLLINPPPSCSSPVEVDYTYDSDGRLFEQSHPYCGSGDPNDVSDRFAHDALDRVTSVNYPDGESVQTDYGSSVGSLNGATSQQGSPSTYGYGYPQVSSDESGHKKEEWLDGFGRIVEVDEPNVSAPLAGTVQITGSEQSISTPYGTTYDTGNVQLTINSSNYYASYGEYDTDASVASELATAISGDPNAPVTAALSGSSIILTGKSPGTYSYSFTSSTFDPNDFYSPSFYGNPQGGSLSSSADSLTNSPVVTNYLYDAGDRLTEVVQEVQTRTFAYDGLGRKISETTPEGGTVTYSYAYGGGLCSGDPSNVCQRTDARGVVTTYTYNNANQLTGVAYSIPGGENISAMPNVCTTTNGTSANVCYYYGQGGSQAYAIGRLTEMVDPTGSESYSHDADGRVTQVSKVISGQTYNIGYQYNAGGDVTQITYPSGRAVQQAYFPAGSLCEIAPTASGCGDSSVYAGGFSYEAPGKLLGFTYGNGVTAAFSYSANRTQLSSLAYSKGTSTYFSQQYWYKQDSTNCPNGSAGNNDSIQCIMDLVDSGRTVRYGYDLLGRMVSAQTSGSTAFPQWGLMESYDRYGNRPNQTVTAGFGPQTSLSFNNNNQPVGYAFDASGNMTVEPLSPPNDMTYDGENLMTAFSDGGGSATYSYDGNGLRVIKSLTGGTTTVSIFSGNSVIAAYDNGAAPSSPSREYIYNGASAGNTTGLLAMISGGATTYFHQDDLSVRLTTDGNGNVVTQEGTFPFGEQWYENGPSNNWVFTSYDRDSESGLDYALARYYDSRTGTFCSADPLAGDPSDPQSWNRYPYGRNDPIDLSDPSGKSWLGWLADIGIGVTAALLPEVAPALFSSGGILFGSTTMTIVESGQTSSAFFAWGAGQAALGGAVGAAVKASMPQRGPQTPTPVPQGGCNLVTPRSATSRAIHYRVAPDAIGYFQPSFAGQIANGIASLNSEGIVPTITSGFRTPASQLAMRMGGSGTNPAAVVSWHQQGLAVDFGTNSNSPFNTQVRGAMQNQGMTWGGNWRGKQNDPVHYQQPRSGTRSPGQLKPNCPISKGGRF